MMYFVRPISCLIQSIRCKVLFAGVMLALLSACANLQNSNVKGPGWYLVKPTDTLYSVAWRYGLDYQQLALWNGLDEPFTIRPGQQLILIEPDETVSEVQSTDEAFESAAVKTKKPVSSGVKVTPVSPSYSQVVRWSWPTEGKVFSLYSQKHLDQRGIDIAGKIGQPVHAVADGKVVYSGTGLSGYGNLIIVKHNDQFLSAYAYNQKRLVSEGMMVKQGTPIAEMGLSKMKGKENVASLHFQIRKQGKPVDPLLYLPDRDK